MSEPDSSTHQDHTEWQSLTEFLVPNAQETEAETAERVAEVLRRFSLDPAQLDQILAAISHSLQSLEDASTPLHLRISVSGVNLAETPPETHPQDSPDSGQNSQLGAGGLGFFLVKRIVGQLQDHDPERYRLVEVLLYRE